MQILSLNHISVQKLCHLNNAHQTSPQKIFFAHTPTLILQDTLKASKNYAFWKFLTIWIQHEQISFFCAMKSTSSYILWTYWPFTWALLTIINVTRLDDSQISSIWLALLIDSTALLRCDRNLLCYSWLKIQPSWTLQPTHKKNNDIEYLRMVSFNTFPFRRRNALIIPYIYLVL